MDALFDKQIHLFLEGRLDDASEELLFRELAHNDDLRREMNTQIRLQSAAKRDATRIIPQDRDKAAIFGRLGLANAGGTSAKATSKLAQRVFSKDFGKNFLRYTVTILVTAFLTWWFLSFGNADVNTEYMATKADTEPQIEMIMRVPMETRVEHVVEKQVVTRIETRYKTITRYIRQDEDSSNVQNLLMAELMNTNVVNDSSAADSFGNNKPDYLSKNKSQDLSQPLPQGFSQYLSQEILRGQSAVEPAQNLALALRSSNSTPFLFADSISKPRLPILPTPKEFVPTAFFATRTAANLLSTPSTWNFKPFSTIALAVGYERTENSILGIEASGDIMEAQRENLRTVAFIPVASIFYRYLFTEWTIEKSSELPEILPECITPFVQANLGASGETVATRLMLGATFYGVSPDKRRWSNSLGLEFTQLFFAPQGIYVPKFTLSFSQNFRL